MGEVEAGGLYELVGVAPDAVAVKLPQVGEYQTGHTHGGSVAGLVVPDGEVVDF